MKDHRQILLLVGSALAAFLAGCGRNPAWQRQSFAFTTPTDAAPAASHTNVVELTRVTISPPFQIRSFTYRIADNTYEQDPYAAFVVAPDRALAEPIRAWMRNGGAFGRVVQTGSGLSPSEAAEASIIELDGDFRNPALPTGAMTIHFTVYEVTADGRGKVLLDKVCARQTPLAQSTPAALVTAWDTDLREIMEEINSDYAKAHLNDR